MNGITVNRTINHSKYSEIIHFIWSGFKDYSTHERTILSALWWKKSYFEENGIYTLYAEKFYKCVILKLKLLFLNQSDFIQVNFVQNIKFADFKLMRFQRKITVSNKPMVLYFCI